MLQSGENLQAPGENCTSAMRVGAVLQPSLLIMGTWKEHCRMLSMNLDEVAPRVLTVTAHLAPGQKIPTDLKQTLAALEREAALCLRKTILREEERLKAS